MVVPGPLPGVGVGGGYVEPGTHVPHVAVGVCECAPVGAGSGELFDGERVVGVDLGELGGSNGWVLVFKECVHLLDAVGGTWCEYGSAVCIVTV